MPSRSGIFRVYLFLQHRAEEHPSAALLAQLRASLPRKWGLEEIHWSPRFFLGRLSKVWGDRLNNRKVPMALVDPRGQAKTDALRHFSSAAKACGS